jgi:plastocyanin
MATFDELLSSLVSNVAIAFGDTVTWKSQDPAVNAYSLSAVVNVGENVERGSGFFATLKNVLFSDLAIALNGSSDLTSLQGDTVTITTPSWAAGTYRVQKVSDPGRDGTVIVDLRKPKQ